LATNTLKSSKALFRAKPNGRGNQRRPKSRWADGGTAITWLRGQTLTSEIGRTVLKTGRHEEIFFNRPVVNHKLTDLCGTTIVVPHKSVSKYFSVLVGNLFFCYLIIGKKEK
jgi:hypothetical protein